MQGSIPILRVGRVLVATLHVDLKDAVAEAFHGDILTSIQKTNAVGVVIDISGLDTVDSYVARVLTDISRTSKLMGATAVLVGMRPEVAMTLVRMGYAMEGIRTALNLEEGIALLGYRLERG
jgi:rsbT antagonist protein RsbS